jgi:hypothetical protein
MLIFGDNLLALKSLEQDFAGRVKCVFIDPPYNTGSAFEQYEDGVEHSTWLSLMRDRLEIIGRLLREGLIKLLKGRFFGRRPLSPATLLLELRFSALVTRLSLRDLAFSIAANAEVAPGNRTAG